MKNLSILFASFLLIQITTLAQAPDTMWTKTFGGIGYDEGNVIIELNDNGFIIGGGTNHNPGYQLPDFSYVIRLNQYGDSLWTRTTQFSGPYTNSGECVIPNLYEISADNYVMGFSAVWSGLLWLTNNGDSVKYDWQFHAGRPGPYMTHLCKTHDGNYILSSYTYSFLVWGGGLKKIDGFGNEIWKKGFSQEIKYVIQTYDGGFAFVGLKKEIGEWLGLSLGKTDSNGDLLWTKNVYPDTIGIIGCKCLEQVTDGGYLILANESNETGDIRLIKTNELGDSLWIKTYGGNESDNGEFFSKTPDGGYIIVGSTESSGTGGSDVWLIKLDSLSNTQWTKTIGGVEDDFGKYVQVTSDGGYIVTGGTYSYGQGESDVWVIKLAPDPLLSVELNNNIVISDYRLAQNYPNPFNPVTTIKYRISERSFVELKIYDVLGNEIKTLVSNEKSAGYFKVEFDASSLPSGIYFYRLQAGSFVETKKMVLIK